jgi:hypothetical protein
MLVQETDEMVGQILRAMVRQEVAAALEGHAVGRTRRGPGGRAAGPNEGGESITSLPGVDPYAVVPYAEHVLRETGGGPLHVSAIAERMYALGFRHRSVPKHDDQLLRSLNSLASPSQHPDKFERVAPRTLKLR